MNTLRFALHIGANLVGIPLEVLILAAMLRGPYRRYPAPFLYMSAVFVVSLIETPLYILGYVYRARWADKHVWSQYVSTYWIDERILMFLVFGVVFSLIYQTTEKARARRILRASVAGGAVLVAAITFAIHYNPAAAPGLWLTAWTSDLYFCAAILDLGLWVLLIGSRSKDSILLMLSGALGILFTGAAISASIGNIAAAKRSSNLSLAGGLVSLMANLTFLYIWWQALRVREARGEPS